MPAAAASSLLAALLDQGCRPVEVARTRVSVHYETGRADVPVLCVGLPSAVRLPNMLVSPVLPSGAVRMRSGALHADGSVWRVGRWWQPSRPHVPAARPRLACDLDPSALVGRGPGLTPAGDDVVAGALVAGCAVRHPALERWRSATRDALHARRTTAVSWGLLHHALDGWATPELAAYVESPGPGPVRERLLAVGSSSGAALAEGVDLVLDVGVREGAA
jgi:hypothetical protein